MRLLWALVGVASLRGSTALKLPGALPRRRLVAGAPAALALALGPRIARAADDRAALKRRALDVLAALEPLPALVDENKWDGCPRRRFFSFSLSARPTRARARRIRSVLKAPPVNELWNLGNGKNWIRTFALDEGDPDLIELAEDLSSALQLSDQYVYDNNFIYFQPGSGKLKIKEPKDQLRISQAKLRAIVDSL